ncbi:ketosteroid isomerase-like protein [Actinomadura coerulea]|uniref:Ketosteroid isomerase-like protein n=1 Tax=Actinomadura coerulea TaxID=46159 RepID=A0A7X0L1F0_9ACTN|nr:nuclear transport factor 2 family protein [Actinomadura coerulea]MBB6398523.1 ketosteroid isomerase-like protein [Actinomadura coerulea]GGQ01219.1 ketosteroid isomerase [Actinomadura coerulea]
MTNALEALERFYAAEADYLAAGGPGKGDFSVMAAHLTPDVVMHQAPSLPYGGTWRGHDGMERFMAVMSELWSDLTFREQHYAVDGETVMVRNDCVFRARATGREVDTSVLQWITVRDGLVSEFRPFYLDTATVLAALNG